MKWLVEVMQAVVVEATDEDDAETVGLERVDAGLADTVAVTVSEWKRERRET